MSSRIDAQVASAQLGQIMDRATRNGERFVVERHGEPAVVILSIEDFIRTASPPPDWLREAWSAAEARGLDGLPMDDIDAEIAAARRERKSSPAA